MNESSLRHLCFAGGYVRQGGKRVGGRGGGRRIEIRPQDLPRDSRDAFNIQNPLGRNPTLRPPGDSTFGYANRRGQRGKGHAVRTEEVRETLGSHADMVAY